MPVWWDAGVRYSQFVSVLIPKYYLASAKSENHHNKKVRKFLRHRIENVWLDTFLSIFWSTLQGSHAWLHQFSTNPFCLQELPWLDESPFSHSDFVFLDGVALLEEQALFSKCHLSTWAWLMHKNRGIWKHSLRAERQMFASHLIYCHDWKWKSLFLQS